MLILLAMADNKKYTDNFKATIKAKLDEIATKDELFAASYAKEGKSLDGCINYILDTVHKSGIQGYTDDEVYGMAIHYYDEDNIKDPGAKQCQVIVNYTVQLTDQEIEEAKEQARKNVYAQQKQKMTTRSKPAPAVKQEVKQATLF
jgi:hypothetical protein